MNFGVVLQTNPPASRVVELARRAETYGFSHAWTFDSHLLWEEPFVIYSRILDQTHKIIVGPMVTNPATRDWTVIASLFATLNEMYGNRTVCGMGRGDSAVRAINGRPVKLAEMRECDRGDPRARQRPVRRVQGLEPALPVESGQPPADLGRRLRTERAQARRRGRRRLHPAAGRSGHHRLVDQRGPRGGSRRRSRPRRADDVRRRARLRHRRFRRAARTCARSVPLVRRHGRKPRPRHRQPLRQPRAARSPRASPTTSRGARATTTTSTARPGTRTPSSCPTRSSSASA